MISFFWSFHRRLAFSSGPRLDELCIHLKNAVFWDVTLCCSCKNQRFRGTSVLTRATQRNIPEDGIVHSHRCENLKSYKVKGWLLGQTFVSVRMSPTESNPPEEAAPGPTVTARHSGDTWPSSDPSWGAGHSVGIAMAGWRRVATV
jgi:hypothetical protein